MHLYSTYDVLNIIGIPHERLVTSEKVFEFKTKNDFKHRNYFVCARTRDLLRTSHISTITNRSITRLIVFTANQTIHERGPGNIRFTNCYAKRFIFSVFFTVFQPSQFLYITLHSTCRFICKKKYEFRGNYCFFLRKEKFIKVMIVKRRNLFLL